MPAPKGSELYPAYQRFVEGLVIAGDCWEWQGKRVNGYGVFTVKGKRTRVHRWAYEHFIEPIPHGLEPDHLCRNRACANPFHVEPVTRSENLRRRPKKLLCKRGHRLSGKNVLINANGARICRACEPFRHPPEKKSVYNANYYRLRKIQRAQESEG